MTLRLVLIDDHLLFREGLRGLISTEPDLAVVAEGADAREVYPLIDAEAPDIAIVDISLRGSSGIAATQEIVRRRPDCKVLILTMHANEDYAAQAFAAGASGYALKDQGMSELLEAIRVVARGGRYVAPSLPARVLEGERTVHPLGALSPREREVFDLIVQRQSNRDISNYLCISIKTVETHRASINRKLGAHSTADLVRLAARLGLIRE
jgi:two-component system nitrate/nitrite response regulator NarL